MPYSESGSDVPKYIRGEKKRRQFSHVWNSVYQREKGKGKSDAEAERLAFASANSVTNKAAEKKYAQLLQKSIESDAEEFARAVLAALQADWESLPIEARSAIETAGLSGVGNGLLQIEISSAGLIASANESARAYALERSAELVGMKYDDEGNLVPNPDAKWAISQTTRDRIREIVAESFTEEIPMAEIRDAIQEALADETEGNGIFSVARAQLIARTEVMRAQTGGNWTTWVQSGIVKKVKWLTAEDERTCPVCEENDNIVREIGKPFPSGHIMPGDPHPLCRCVAVVDEVVT